MEDAGAAAVVLHSLFEEQLWSEWSDIHDNVLVHMDSFSEAQGFFPVRRLADDVRGSLLSRSPRSVLRIPS